MRPRTATMTIGGQRRQRQVVHEAGAEDQQQRRGRRAPASPASWLRAPTSSATAVRELLEEIGKPWKNPVATLATPSDRQLLVLVDVLVQPARVAARQDARVGERDEGDPDRRREQRLEVVERDVGHADGGRPGGDRADHRHLDRRGRARRPTAVAPTTAMKTPGHLRRDPPQAEDQRERRRRRWRARSRWSRRGPRRSRARAGMKLSASTEKPNSLGSCATITVTAMPIR